MEDVLPYGVGFATYDEALDEFLPPKEEGALPRYHALLGRLTFNLYDASGRVIGFAGRDMTGRSLAKYWNSPTSPIFNKGSKLYGLNWAKRAIRRLGFVVLVEGQIDVIRCHLEGLTNVVATMGTAVKKEHAQILHRYADRAVVLYDNDPVNDQKVNPGQKAAKKAIKVLEDEGMLAVNLKLAKGEDPDTFILEHGSAPLKKKIERAVETLLEAEEEQEG